MNSEIRVRVAFLWRDLWFGIYIGQPQFGVGKGPLPGIASARQFRERSLYICLVPMFPIVITRTEWGL
jgi:hypothetical protein